MKILIIGATGLLAKPVYDIFDQKGYSLRLFSRSINDGNYPDRFEIVKGDVFNETELNEAMGNCDAVHITLSKVDESQTTELIIKAAKARGIKLISYVSGCTVAEQNRWFPMIDQKYRAEQTVKNSGIPWLIFRPTWFFETIELMIRGDKAMMIGKQPKPWRWIAADDFGKMVAKAYEDKLQNSEFQVMGKEPFLMKELMEEYCRELKPEIKKVSSLPIAMAKLIGKISRKPQLVNVAKMFAYFEKVEELGDPEETWKILGEPSISWQQWLENKKA